MPKGQIIKVLAGFYYVDTGEKVVSCRARGKFRNRGQKPLVGDFCTFQERKRWFWLYPYTRKKT